MNILISIKVGVSWKHTYATLHWLYSGGCGFWNEHPCSHFGNVSGSVCEYSVYYNSLQAQCLWGGVKKSGAFDNIAVKVVFGASLSIHGMLTKVVCWCWCAWGSNWVEKAAESCCYLTGLDSSRSAQGCSLRVPWRQCSVLWIPVNGELATARQSITDLGMWLVHIWCCYAICMPYDVAKHKETALSCMCMVFQTFEIPWSGEKKNWGIEKLCTPKLAGVRYLWHTLVWQGGTTPWWYC